MCMQRSSSWGISSRLWPMVQQLVVVDLEVELIHTTMSLGSGHCHGLATFLSVYTCMRTSKCSQLKNQRILSEWLNVTADGADRSTVYGLVGCRCFELCGLLSMGIVCCVRPCVTALCFRRMQSVVCQACQRAYARQDTPRIHHQDTPPPGPLALLRTVWPLVFEHNGVCVMCRDSREQRGCLPSTARGEHTLQGTPLLAILVADNLAT
jgi:hypothetical protein